jgi:hypothetical protein
VITAEAAEAWRQGDFHLLNRLLAFYPHQISPFDAGGRPPKEGELNPGYAATWPRAAEMRKRLIEVAGPPGHWNRHGEPLGPSTDGRPGYHHGNVPPDHEGYGDDDDEH